MRALAIVLSATLLIITSPQGGVRDLAAVETGGRGSLEPPETVVYETWFAGGTRVEFGHALHADMLELDCSMCHHAENCRNCHQETAVIALATTSRVALHGACFRCHEQGSDLEECDLCHVGADDDHRYGGVESSVRMGGEDHDRRLGILVAAQAAGELEIVGELLPFERETPPPPEEHLFLTPVDGTVSVVQFSHADHAEEYGIACAECHHMERCGHCHLETTAPVDVAGLDEALMDNCIRCHEDLDIPTSCEACHHDPHPR